MALIDLDVSFVEIFAVKALDAFSSKLASPWDEFAATACFFCGALLCVGLDRISHRIGGGHGHSHGHPDDKEEHHGCGHDVPADQDVQLSEVEMDRKMSVVGPSKPQDPSASAEDEDTVGRLESSKFADGAATRAQTSAEQEHLASGAMTSDHPPSTSVDSVESREHVFSVEVIDRREPPPPETWLPSREINQVLERYTDAIDDERHHQQQHQQHQHSHQAQHQQDYGHGQRQSADTPLDNRLCIEVAQAADECKVNACCQQLPAESPTSANGLLDGCRDRDRGRTSGGDDAVRLRIAAHNSTAGASDNKQESSSAQDNSVGDRPVSESAGERRRQAELIKTGLMTGLAIGLHNFPGMELSMFFRETVLLISQWLACRGSCDVCSGTPRSKRRFGHRSRHRAA